MLESSLPLDRLPPPCRDEAQAVAALRHQLSGQLDWSAVRDRAEPWVHGVRRHPGPPWALESLLHEFPLSSQEGLALMRLAEALLRVPDGETALAFTADQLKPSGGNLSARLRSGPAEEGLLAGLTHRVLSLSQSLLPEADHAPTGWLQRLGGPTVVAATVRSVQLLGQQFVLGQTMEEALAKASAQRQRATAQGQALCFSMDMLGEGARTWEDADRYFAAYQNALNRLGQAGSREPGTCSDGLSIKLSALHPRLEMAHAPSVSQRLLPRLVELCAQAAAAGLQLTLDAEESWRLELQLALLDQLMAALRARAPGSWTGLGVAVQAYQHRSLPVLDELARLALVHERRLTVRLVKGAYWDGEVKRAQELGLPGFPVYTRKAHTDLSYLACAQRLLSHRAWLSPQFATHNAATVAAVLQLAQRQGVPLGDLEWQRLHGMGEATWREILADPAMHHTGPPVLRVYAPVGAHRDLLAYLVRRLLENGANASFVHQLADPQVPTDTLLASPLIEHGDAASPVTPPRLLFGPERLNAWGRDLHQSGERQRLDEALRRAQSRHDTPLPSPASLHTVASTMSALHQSVADWEAHPERRIAMLDSVANRLEQELDDWAADLVLEARKTWPDAVAEVRETVDFARYYAQQARLHLQPRLLPGPTGERNEWRLRPRGVWVCISPWNFPLAIFGGQVMAALVMGNSVAAKPAEQTPRIALRLTQALHDAGVPADVLACLCGSGASVGEALVRHRLCAGVAFTGSVATAGRLQQMLTERATAQPAQPLVPLIAETGGLNALIADSTALPEQLLDTVMASAFGSAGQRCSALRLLCLHTAIAAPFEALLKDAMGTLLIGHPERWQTDVGPVIDEPARERLQRHLAAMQRQAAETDNGTHVIAQAPVDPELIASGLPFVPPTAFALPAVASLREEHFGPILHVVRWGPGCAADTLDALIDQINASGFGLTLGVHTRIDARVAHIARRARVGNVYVNRTMTGAVVGSQPFGGQGMSGTGPKAGGPLYLPRFSTEQVVCINTAAAGGNVALMSEITR